MSENTESTEAAPAAVAEPVVAGEKGNGESKPDGTGEAGDESPNSRSLTT